MSEECKDESCMVSIEPTSEEVKEEVRTAKEKKEKLPLESELAFTLGALTSVCNISEEDKKDLCFQAIEPLETKNAEPKEVIKTIIEQQGAENIERSMKAIEELILEAKEELKKEGKI